jgi:RimJ/RimL family protein N-acetyltransferase
MNQENVASYATAAANGMTRIKAYEDGDEALFVYRITRDEWQKTRNEND